MCVKQLCTLKNNAKTNYCIFLISTMTLVGFNAMTLSQNKGDENKGNSIKFQKRKKLSWNKQIKVLKEKFIKAYLIYFRARIMNKLLTTTKNKSE